jgi:hypothetical protein
VTRSFCRLAFFGMFSVFAQAHDFGWIGSNSLALPQVGEHTLRILSPTVLELTLINTKKSESSPVSTWDFVGPNFAPKIPDRSEFRVLVEGKEVPVERVGFKRRALYAPLKVRDLRILNELYLEISVPIRDGQRAEVQNTKGQLWTPKERFQAVADPLRFNPAIHVNQVGYAPKLPKRAMAGYYLGSAGELKIAAEQFTRWCSRAGCDAARMLDSLIRRRPIRTFSKQISRLFRSPVCTGCLFKAWGHRFHSVFRSR